MSTLFGCASAFASLTSDAAVTCAIMKPEHNPERGDRNAGRSRFRCGSTSCDAVASSMPPANGTWNTCGINAIT